MLYRKQFAALLFTLLTIGICSHANAIPLGGLIQDLDADVGVVAAGTNVSNWNAVIGDNVATNGGSPQLIANALNGHNAVRLTNDKLSGSNVNQFDASLSGSGYTWFAVVDPDSNTGSKNRIFGTLTNANPFSGQTADVDNNRVHSLYRTGAEENLSGATQNIHDLGPLIMAGRLGAGADLGDTIPHEVFLNSATPDGVSTANVLSTADAGAITIGAERTGGSEFYNGDIFRILFYDRPLTDDELNEVGFELAQLYGIQAGFDAPPVPEPVTSLFAISAAGALTMRRRRANAA